MSRNDALRKQARLEIHLAATRFAEHDADGDQALSFDEFYTMQPQRIKETRSVEEMRAWFDAMNVNGKATEDIEPVTELACSCALIETLVTAQTRRNVLVRTGNGYLSIDEFFVWSLGRAAVKLGAGSLVAFFEKFDKDRTGFLDPREFLKLCRYTGFGSGADTIFRALDSDHSGVLSYPEFSTIRATNADPNFKCNQVMAVDGAFDTVDTAGWRIRGTTAEDVKRELQELLQSSGAHVSDMIRIFDTGSDTGIMLIADVEFYSAMREKLDFRGPGHVLQDIFRSLDTDGTGQIGFDEMFEFVRGYRHSLDQRKRMQEALKIQPPPGAAYTINDIVWNVETLRTLMQQMIARSGVGTTHLIDNWDKSGDGELSMREFSKAVETCFIDLDPKLWQGEVKPVVELAFKDMDLVGRHGGKSALVADKVDIVELEQWINRPASRGGVIATKKAKRAKNMKNSSKTPVKRDIRLADAPSLEEEQNEANSAFKAMDETVSAIEILARRAASARDARADFRTLPVATYSPRPFVQPHYAARMRWQVPTELLSLPPIPRACHSPWVTSDLSPRLVRDPPDSNAPIWVHYYADTMRRKAHFPESNVLVGRRSPNVRRTRMMEAARAASWMELGP